jgi:hypothetical protein
MSNRGGKRDGAGGKSSWNYGKTKPVRVPVALASKVLEIARILDDGDLDQDVTGSKVIDLTGVAVRQARDGAVVRLSDLIRLGFQIKPDGLMRLASRKADGHNFELEELLRIAEEKLNE